MSNPDRPTDAATSSQRKPHTHSRRDLFAAAAGSAIGLTALGCAPAPEARAADNAPKRDPFRYGLNTGTIRGHKLPLDQQIDVAMKTGYDGIEPWLGDMAKYAESGGSLKDLAKKCADGGFEVYSAIGFAQWIVDDDAKRAAGLESAKRDMDLVKQLGGTHLAAPPAGANKGPKIDLWVVAERYRALLEIGHDIGVIPEVEVWGFSTNLTTLAESTFVAIAAGHPDAVVLPDVYHLFKGGSPAEGLKLLGRNAVRAMHVNDYPKLDRDKASDADRVYPGDGVAPLDYIFTTLAANGVGCYLSLEMFNRDYWAQPVEQVTKTGLAKSKAAVAKALGL
ncbi:MAG: TIM barrel protein [Phycisphaera sp.]|nr:TIM barrel protein [Phycisphaera sp.]